MNSAIVCVLLSILSGVLSGISFNNVGFSFLIWCSFIPLFYVIEKSSLKGAFFHSFLCGIVFFLTVLFWVGYVTKLGLIVLILYVSLYWGVFGYAARICFSGPFKFLTIPSCWIILEFLRENIWAGFGWGLLGYSQHGNSLLIQSADILGVKFISGLIILSNMVMCAVIKKRSLRLKELVVLLGVIAMTVVYSHHRIETLKPVSSLRLSLIQTNIPQSLKWEKSYFATTLATLKRLAQQSVDNTLVICPEASYPFVIREETRHAFQQFFKEVERDIVVGAIEEKEKKFYNAAIFLDSKGNIKRRYYKINLVPFGEYVPGRSLFRFISVLNMMGDISCGEAQSVFEYAGKRFSVLICFEDLFPLLVREFSKTTDFLINITNDAWFLGEPQATQHLAIMKLRAIENRISIVRVANTGITGWVSFRGEESLFESEGRATFFAGVFDSEVPLNQGRSFYTLFPDIIIVWAVLVLLIAFLWGRKNKDLPQPHDKVGS
jgi:apolipoprotein N-acyltransferase